MRERKVKEIDEILKMLNGLNPHLWFMVQAAAYNRNMPLLDTILRLWKELDKIFNRVCRLKK